MSDARANILGRLKAAPRTGSAPVSPGWRAPSFGDQRLERFARMLAASHAELHEVTAADWPGRLASILANKGVGQVMYAPATDAGATLAADWSGRAEAPGLMAYDQPVEVLKEALVREADAALTTTVGAIAETGTLALWPDQNEPRLLSLLPPIHVALVRAADVADNLPGLISAQGWAGRLPTNVVLVSGPSKTADIEQTLAYGVHGPKELIVLLLKDAE